MPTDPRVEPLARVLAYVDAEDAALGCGRSTAEARSQAQQTWTDYAEIMRDAWRDQARRVLSGLARRGVDLSASQPTGDRQIHPTVAAAMEILPNGPDPDAVIAWTTVDGQSVPITREEMAAGIVVRVARQLGANCPAENSGVMWFRDNLTDFADQIEDQYRTEGDEQ